MTALHELENILKELGLTTPIPGRNLLEPLDNPLKIFRNYLAEILGELTGCGSEDAVKSIQWPNNVDNGDLAVILPKLVPGKKANDVAVDLASKFPKNHPLFPLPFLEGVHFRIFIKPNALAKVLLPWIDVRREDYGRHPISSTEFLPDAGREQRHVVVEFSSPNITGDFQGKHLRSTILGAFIGRIFENMGWKATKINYLGDWGKSIGLLKVGWDRFGSEEKYQQDSIGHLRHVYRQISACFKPEELASKQARDEASKISQDEGEAQAQIQSQGIYAQRDANFTRLEAREDGMMAFWKRIRDISIENLRETYAKLGIHFEEYSGESQVLTETMLEIEEILQRKQICKESAGALVIHMQDYGLKAGTAIIRDRTGARTYLLRDLAAILERWRKFQFHKMILVAANDHNIHFLQLHHILKAMDLGEIADKVQHLKFSESSKMLDHIGTGSGLGAILSHCEKDMISTLKIDEEHASVLGEPKRAADCLAITGLLIHESSIRTASAHNFDTSAITAFKPGSGPYMQYWYTILCSILADRDIGITLCNEDYEALLEEEQANLLRVLAQYPELTHAAYQALEPSVIVTYLNTLIEHLTECLGAGGGNAVDLISAKVLQPAHIVLYGATRIVIENCFKLLGVNPYHNYEEAERNDSLLSPST